MNKIINKLFITILLLISCNLYSQNREISLSQVDARFTFTISVEANYNMVNDESILYSVQNNTGDKFELEIEVTVNSTCHPASTYKLGHLQKVYLEPYGQFTPEDNPPCVLIGGSNFKECRRKIGDDAYTYISGIRYRYLSIINLTVKEREEAKAKALELEKKKLKEAEEKAKREKIAFDKEVQQIKEQREKERLLAEKEESATATSTTNSSSSSSSSSAPKPTSYYNTNASTSSKPKQPTWQERNAQIQEENRRINAQNQQRIAETQKRSQEQSEQFVENATQLIDMVGGLLEQGRIEREKKEAKQAAAAQRERERRQEEQERLAEIARQKAQLVSLRNSFLDEYADGGVPLSSQKVNTNELYYFTYIFDRNTIEDSRPTILLSNIFAISQYSDGTWPFKSSIVSDIKKLSSDGTITLVGYFTTEALAEEMRTNFLQIAASSSFAISDINYKGKKTTSTTSNTDFWETNSKPKQANSAGKADDDFWETGKPKKKAPEEKKKEEVKPKTEKKDDFWNE